MTGIGKLRIMDGKGDTTVKWDTDQEDAVKEAERIFREHQNKGTTAFRVAGDGTATRIAVFDREADQIVMVPRVAGG